MTAPSNFCIVTVCAVLLAEAARTSWKGRARREDTEEESGCGSNNDYGHRKTGKFKFLSMIQIKSAAVGVHPKSAPTAEIMTGFSSASDPFKRAADCDAWHVTPRCWWIGGAERMPRVARFVNFKPLSLPVQAG